MKTLNPASRTRLQKTIRGLALGIVLLTAVAAVASHAADGRDRGRSDAGDRDWREHEGQAHNYWHRSHFVAEPGVVYAPPVVYQPPQYEEPGINFIIPLNFR